MADLYSFDVVSKIDLQEVKNAIDQAVKELRQRFDLKDAKGEILLQEEKELCIAAQDEHKLKAVIDILQSKLVKRGIPLKNLVYEKIEKALGGTVRQKITLQQGIPSDNAKEVNKSIRDTRVKVTAQIQGDQLRISGKNKDDLQTIMAHLRSKDFGIDLQFVNYR